MLAARITPLLISAALVIFITATGTLAKGIVVIRRPSIRTTIAIAPDQAPGGYDQKTDQFRGKFLNIFNHENLGYPDIDMQDSNFDVSPRLGQVALKLFGKL